MTCPLCDRNILCEKHQYPYFIHEFKHSYLVLGTHQYYQGYAILITKKHYREMTDIPEKDRSEFFEEMMKTSSAIQAAFAPKKMNMCSLGNVVEHMHWHFFPRYANDPLFNNPPWLQMKDFESASVSPEQAQENIAKIKARLF